MADSIIYPVGEDTGRRIARAIEALAASRDLVFNEALGYYEDDSVVRYLERYRNGRNYGVSLPTSLAIAGTKLGANAGIARPTPGWIGHPATDPYTGLGPFAYVIANVVVDADGNKHVAAIEGDGRFRRDGSNGNVLNVHLPIWESWTELSASTVRYISDTKKSGMSLHPQCYLPSGEPKPFMTCAVYPLGVNPYDGSAASVSGVRCRTRDVSHNSYISICGNASTGWSGKSTYDDWYVQVMFDMKYATKHSQSVFAGCSNYNLNYAVTVAESDTTRVIVATSNAANLIVGSSVSLGASDHSNSVLSESRILKVEEYDGSNSAVYLDVTGTFTTTTSLKLSTGPWFCGSLDDVEGDGALTQAGLTNGREPFKLQGIELMHGMNEILGNVIVANDGTSGWTVYVNNDSRNEATSLTSDYVSTGLVLPTDATDSWKYPTHARYARGIHVGTDTGGSQATGLCDGHYTNKLETTGTREWQGLGHLASGGDAGLRYVGASNGLGGANWSIGGRLSADGRARAA